MSEETALHIGRVRGVTPTKWQRVWAGRYAARLAVTDVADDAAVPALRDGSLDMCFVRLPVDREGLHAIPLYEEQMVAWVSKEHVISAVDEVSLADLEDEQVITELDAVATDLVLGGAVLIVPMSIAREASRRDLTSRPITDAPPSGVALAWLVENENPLIEDFIGVVRGRTVNSSRAASGQAAGVGSQPSAGAPAGRGTRGRRGTARRGR